MDDITLDEIDGGVLFCFDIFVASLQLEMATNTMEIEHIVIYTTHIV